MYLENPIPIKNDKCYYLNTEVFKLKLVVYISQTTYNIQNQRTV